MRRKRGDTQQAQVLGEYAIVIGVIAFVCIVALLYFGVVLRGDFQSGGEQVQQTPFQPPTPSAPRSWPSALADCEHDGWKNFPQFANEDECVEYVDDLPP